MKKLTLFLFLLMLSSISFAGMVSAPPGAGFGIDENTPLAVREHSFVCAENSSTNLLAGDVEFTGEWESTLNFSVILVMVKSDVSSALDGLIVEFSADGVTAQSTDEFTIPANAGKTYSFQPVAEYFRVRYINGSTIQTSFVLHTQKKADYVKPSSHRIGDEISGEDDAELVKAALTGEDSLGDWHNVSVTHDGDLSISDNSSGLSIARGHVTGVTFEHKFGNAPDFDTDDGTVSVWDGADDGGINQMTYTYSSGANIDSISSSSIADSNLLEITGCDVNTNAVIVTNTMAGQARVALSTNFLRVVRLRNIGSTTIAGTVYCYENGAITTGTPDDLSTVRALINNGNNQTIMGIYTIPAGKTGYMRDWFASTAGASRSSSYVVDLYARPPGQVFQLKHKSSVSDLATGYIQHKYEEPEVFEAGTDIEMRVSMEAVGGSQASISAGFDLVLVDD